ncbi:MAG TPA: hypothetical protein VN634_16550 [Candidatus Limnocylindrales bacterium]|nr:hypothetical protein [Candidatus Limnocylindrales bacterium]
MNDPRRTGRPGLCAEQAFVVHLLETEAVHGRVEHVSSGRATRFGSAAELIDFMRGTLEPAVVSEPATK